MIFAISGTWANGHAVPIGSISWNDQEEVFTEQVITEGETEVPATIMIEHKGLKLYEYTNHPSTNSGQAWEMYF